MRKNYKKLTILSFITVTTIFLFCGQATAAPKVWDGVVHAPLKTAQPYDWAAPDEFFTGDEGASIKYYHENAGFEGVLELYGFKQKGPYVLTVDTADGTTLAGYDCDVWNPWADLYGETFTGGDNGCWAGEPYVDVKLFSLVQYDSNGDSVIGGDDYYGGMILFDVPLLNGTYNLKFFVKLDWHLTSPSANIMMMNDMTGNPRYGKVVSPKKVFDYDEDLIIEEGLGTEKLVLADAAWCESIWPLCVPPDQDIGYQGTTGVVFYSTLAQTFQGTVVLSNTVTPPAPTSQPFQIKLEGMGSMTEDAASNEEIGYIGRWWDNDTNANISDTQYEAVKDTHDVLGYVVFDGFETAGTSKTFALDSSYHTLWTPQTGRPAPGFVVMTEGDYVAYFALTENSWFWRGVFLSENPLEFTIE